MHRALLPRLGVLALCTALSTCAGPTGPSPDSRPALAGRWSGTTSQGMPFEFIVSASERVTGLTVGYTFNGCSGTQTFSGLDLPTAPEVICIPGPCPGGVSSYRAFGYATSGPIDGPRTAVNGLFLPGNRAEGQVSFVNYADCGSASGVAWTATKR